MSAALWADRGISIGTPSDVDGVALLTRGDLFEMGASLSSDQEVLNFVWHVLAWGSGTNQRNNDARVESLKGDPANVALLRHAVDAAKQGDIREAYSSLVRPGRAAIPSLGPAFFSKILYFASEGVTPRCLILDARVAQSLYGLGWNMSRGVAPKSFSWNWFTDTYVSYCGTLNRWAKEIDSQAPIRPDIIERVLWDASGSAV